MKRTLTLITCCLVVALLATQARAARNRVTDDAKKVARGTNDFAAELYGKLSADQGNLFFSPTSISTALAMTYGGARGQTAEQMVRVMHYPFEGDKLHGAMGSLMDHLNPDVDDDKRPYQLVIANALWGEQTTNFKDDYLKSTEKHYGAGLTPVDFKTAGEEVRKQINQWVEQKTNDKIKDLIPAGTLTPDTRLVLTNAIYFKSAWADKFNKRWTQKHPFKLAPDKSVEVPLMHRSGRYGYAEFDDLEVVEIPYERHELSMVVMLPKADDGLSALEKKLDKDTLHTWTSGAKYRRVNLYLPKFKTTSKFELSPTLQSMGMGLAFSPARADFSGITAEDPLYISNVIHKAFVDVHEEGTEAAAATAVVMKAGSAPRPEKPVEVKVDHPFVFVIRDNRSGAILFMGRIVDPRK